MPPSETTNETTNQDNEETDPSISENTPDGEQLDSIDEESVHEEDVDVEIGSDIGSDIHKSHEPLITTPYKLHRHIGIKLEILKERDDIIQVKLAKYQKTNEYLNIWIIFISSVLSVYEAFRGKIDDLVSENIPSIFVNMVPIVLSASITCIASIIKLKKYQEKSDNIHLTREKVSVARCKLKHIQEDLLFVKSESRFQHVRKSYFSNAYDFYCEAQSYLDKYIKSKDYVRYGGILDVYSKCCCYTKYIRKKIQADDDDNPQETSTEESGCCLCRRDKQTQDPPPLRKPHEGKTYTRSSITQQSNPELLKRQMSHDQHDANLVKRLRDRMGTDLNGEELKSMIDTATP